MSAYNLSEVHEITLIILKEIDRICRKYKLRYLIDSGTLLGAVRHQGFVPWDDDGDVAFTRDQYQSFLKVVKRELPPGMSLLMPDELRGGTAFYDFCARIVYEPSQVHRDSEEMRYYGGKLNHLYVDLFVIDKLPQHKMAQTGVILLQTVLYGLAMGHRYRVDLKKYRGIQKLAVGCFAGIGRWIPMKFLFALHDKVSAWDRKGKGELRYYSNYAPDYFHVRLERDWCEEVVEMEFSGECFMAPGGWRQVLTLVYGNYMKLPPPEKRIPSHSSTFILANRKEEKK